MNSHNENTIKPTVKNRCLKAFFWSGKIFCGTENKDKGQRMEQLAGNSGMRGNRFTGALAWGQ